MEFTVVKRVAKAALAANTGSADSVGPSTDISVVDRDERVDGNSSAKPTLSKGFAETRDENALKKAAAHCFPAE